MPKICNATGEAETDPDRIKKLLLRQLAARLDFRKAAKNLPAKAVLWEVCLPPESSLAVVRLIEASRSFQKTRQKKTKVRRTLAPLSA